VLPPFKIYQPASAGKISGRQLEDVTSLPVSRCLSRFAADKDATLRGHAKVYRVFHGPDVLTEIEENLGAVDVTSDGRIHQEQFDFAIV
jgi:hypothetical protein